MKLGNLWSFVLFQLFLVSIQALSFDLSQEIGIEPKKDYIEYQESKLCEFHEVIYEKPGVCICIVMLGNVTLQQHQSTLIKHHCKFVMLDDDTSLWGRWK